MASQKSTAAAPRPQSRGPSFPLILLSLVAIGITIYFTVWNALRAELATHTGIHIERHFWQHGPELYDNLRVGKLELPQELKDLKERLWDSWYSQGFKWGEELSAKGKAAWEEYSKKKSEL